MYYAGSTLDRAAGARSTLTWSKAVEEDPGARLVPLWRDQCLVRDGEALSPPGPEAAAIVAALAGEPVFLGFDAGTAVFAADLSHLAQDRAVELLGADGCADVRALVDALGRERAGLIAYARGLLYWHRSQRFCGACGGRTTVREAGHMRECEACGQLLFPRIEPAVITLVELAGRPARCLLGRHQGAAAERFSTLAGFVEVGESLEDAVRREVGEEAGVAVGDVTYQASQAWPFPAGLMAGFHAVALSDHICVDNNELVEARWFTAAELRDRASNWPSGGPYRVDSIGKFLVESWIARQS